MIWFDNLFPWFGDMLQLGGDILLVIIVVACGMWAIILERLVYFYAVLPHQQRRVTEVWKSLRFKDLWQAQQCKMMLVSRLYRESSKHLQLVMTLVKVCPLLGLLGTVMGMLEIFDVLAITGNNSARATAGGVSKATVSTMAGMVVAISGYMISNHLLQKAESARVAVRERLVLDGHIQPQGGVRHA